MTELINLIYALIEKKLLFQEIVSNDIDENSFEKSDVFLSSEELMIKIRETYSKNEKFQRIINVKQINDCKISVDFRKKYQLKLRNCKIDDDLLRVNNKIVIFNDDVLQIKIIKIHHDKFITKHFDRTDIFANVFQHY